jgi:hypothetical protein
VAVWKSHSHAAAVKADPSYDAFIQKRQALATAPVTDLHVCFSGNPLRCLAAPFVEVDIYRTEDARAAEAQELVRRLTYRVESLQTQGFIALSWGVPMEDDTRGVWVAGWRSIEVRCAVLSHPHAQTLRMMAGAHAHGHDRLAQDIGAGGRSNFRKI